MIEAVVYIFCTVVGAVKVGSISVSLYPYTFAMLAGMICLLVYSINGSKNSESVENDSETENLFTKNANRTRATGFICASRAR